MPQTYHFNLSEVFVTAMGVGPIADLIIGEAITVEKGDVTWKFTKAHGAGIRVRNPNDWGKFKLTLLYGSVWNARLAERVAFDARTGKGAGPLVIEDLNGTSLITATSCFCEVEPPWKGATESSPIEWNFIADGLDIKHGANVFLL